MIQITKSCRLEVPCYDDGKCHFTKPCDCQYLTNADRIRNMSDEEMARFLDEISGFQADYLKYKGKAIDAVHLIDWLRQPAEE